MYLVYVINYLDARHGLIKRHGPYVFCSVECRAIFLDEQYPGNQYEMLLDDSIERCDQCGHTPSSTWLP